MGQTPTLDRLFLKGVELPEMGGISGSCNSKISRKDEMRDRPRLELFKANDKN